MSYNKKNDKYPALNCKEVVRALEKAGAELKRQKGGHAIYELHGRTIVVPVHGKKTIPLGTLFCIIRQSGLSKEDFYKLVGFTISLNLIDVLKRVIKACF